MQAGTVRSWAVWSVIAAVAVLSGCGADNARFTTPERMDEGLVVILPGIEGVSEMNLDIRRGLVRGGVDRALPIYSWRRPIPIAGVLINQMDFLGNRLEGIKLAKMITEYQDAHPGRPVYLIGHSGGGGVAVFAAEAMPEGRQVDGLVLLSASISKGYNATKALKRCRNGIVNFYNRSDAGLLGVGTTVVGNVDGVHGPSAGLEGFDPARSGDPEEKRLAYARLYQVALSPSMTGGGDPHAAATHPGFVASYVVPWIRAQGWPAGKATIACIGQ